MSVLDTFPSKWSGMQREWDMAVEMIDAIVHPTPSDLYFFTEGAGLNAGIGKGTVAPTAAGENSLAQGDASTAGGVNSFAQGDTASAGGAQSFAQGDASTASGANSFAQGDTASAGGAQSFAQGKSVQAGGLTSFGQGYSILANSNYVMAQGQATGSYSATHVLAQGQNMLSYSSHVAMQGFSVVNYTERALIQGATMSIGASGTGSYDMIVQGYGHYSYASAGIAQGDFSYVGTAGAHVTNSSVIGTSHQVYSDNCLAFGDNHIINASSNNSVAFGQDHTIAASSEWSFCQGESNTCSAARGFAQGYYAHSYRADQKSFGSNRTTGLGHSQSSEVIKHVATPGNTTTTIFDMQLEPWKSYSFMILIAAKKRSADDAASFSHDDQLAYLDAALDGAVLVPVGGPLGGNQAVGTGATLTAALDANSDNIRVRVTGNAAEDWDWTCSVRFVEAYVAA